MSNTITKQSLSAEAAKKMIAAAEAKAVEIKRRMCIAICDESGDHQPDGVASSLNHSLKRRAQA